MGFIVVIAFGLIPAYIAQKKGRRGWLYFALSLVTSPFIMTIVALCVSNLNNVPQLEGGDDIVDGDPYAQYQDNMYDDTAEEAGYNLLSQTEVPEAEDAVFTEVPAQEAPVVEEIPANICPYCGSAVKEGSKFCENCGAPLQ